MAIFYEGVPFGAMLVTLSICVTASFIAGFIDSIAGGGGLITLPAYYAVGIPAHMALGTNKFANSIGTLTALLRFLKEGQINIKVALVAALGAQIAARRLKMIATVFVTIAILPLVPGVGLYRAMSALAMGDMAAVSAAPRPIAVQ